VYRDQAKIGYDEASSMALKMAASCRKTSGCARKLKSGVENIGSSGVKRRK